MRVRFKKFGCWVLVDVEASGVSVHCLIFNGIWLCLIAAPLSSRHSLPHAKELIFLALGDGPRQKKIHSHSGKHHQSHIPRIFEWKNWRICAESHTRTNTGLDKLQVVLKQFLAFDSRDPKFQKFDLFFNFNMFEVSPFHELAFWQAAEIFIDAENFWSL